MINLLINADFIERLCLTLLHSVWQVALLALFATVCSWLLCRKNVYWKYTIHVAALIVALLAMPLTFVMVESRPTQANALPIMAVGDSSIKAIPRPEAVDSASASLQPRSIVIPREVNAETTGAIESPASASASVVDADASSDKPSQWWTTLAFWMSGMYLLGVATMLARLLVSILKSSQLASQGQRIKDGPAWEILQNLCSEWSLQVKPSLMQAERIVVPKVVGLIRPAILLPASALTGLSSEQLEMILAHELAHIRRYDMWVYLLQRLAEAVLFFNPALWFLNRRISDLREYCCDEMACEIASGSQLDADEPRLRYAQALLRVVELKVESSAAGVESVAALAAVGHSPSELRRRVARLFGEPLREPIRISRTGVCLLLAITTLFCIGSPLWSAASNKLVVNASKQQEPAEIGVESSVLPSEIQSLEIDGKKESATVSGHIVLEDGSPADVKGWMLTDLRRPNGNGETGTQDQYVDKFSFETGAGTMWLTYYADGYAPVWTDKFEIKPGEKRDDFRLTLKSGISTKVRVSDEKGQPIAGATIVAHPEIHGTCQGPVFKHTTDENGEYQMTHLAKTRYQLKITASGFQPLQTAPLRVEDGETLRPTMVRSQPSTGIVRFADGTPAPYSKIRCKYEMRANGRGVGHGNEGEGFWGSVFATADENGRFNMDELAEGSRYLMIVEAVDGARAIVHDLQAGQQDVQVVLPRRRDLVVKIKGDLNKYTKPNRKPFVAIRQSVAVSFKPGQNRYDLIGADAPVELTTDGGMVIFRGLAVDLDGPGKGQQKVSVTLGYDPKTKQTVDLNLTGGTIVEFDLSDEVKSDQPSPETKQDGILWGESQDGLKLGIRPSDLSRHATRFRHGDVIAYEAWVKNETKTTIHVPYDPRHIYGPRFKDNKFELLNHLSWVRYAIPPEVFDKSVVSLSPGEAKPYPKGQQLQGSIQPVGTDGEHSGSALSIPIGTYDCLANYEFNYQEGLKYDRRDTRNDKRVKLSSGVAKIQVLPSARLEIREAALVSESKIDRSILAKDATRKFINWEMIDGQKDELFFNRFAPPITNEDDVISAVAKPSEHDSESYSVYLRLTPRAGQRLFSETTRLLKNVASSRPRLPILLDGKVLMAPMLQSTLKEQIAITGNFTKAEAQQLATEISSASAVPKQNAPTTEPVMQPLSAVPNNAFLVAEVIDAETGKPIDKFTALAGVNRMEGLGWQWQPHTIHAYQNGQLQWPPAKRRGYDKQVLRVEADGYLPYETPLLIKLGPDEVPKPAGARGAANGETFPNALQGRVGEPATFKILLRRDAGTRGRVLDPDGKPVQGAIVAIGMGNHRTVRIVNRSIKITDQDSNASLRDQWEVLRHTTTDSTGKFELPTETAPGVIAAVHRSGIAVNSVAEFQRGSDLQLQPWGRIEGQIDWGDASAEGEKISLIAYGRPHTEFRSGFSFVSQSAKAIVDKSGKFTFENVPPGAVQLGRESNPPGDWNGSTSLNPVWHVSVDAGKTLAYVIGGPGGPVTGKVTGFDNWKNVTVSITKELHYPRPGWRTNPKDPTWPAFNAYMASPAYKFFNKDAVNIEADGTFRVENVAAESYVVTVMEKTDDQVIQRGNRKLTIEPMVDGKSDTSLDVGIIKMDPIPPSKKSKKNETNAEATPNSTPQPPGIKAGTKNILKLEDGTTFTFRWCPPGEFQMGSNPDFANQYGDLAVTQHRVQLTKGFWLAETEVTRGQYRKIVGEVPAPTWGGTRGANVDQFPVESVSWNDAANFCKKLSAQTTGITFRLPTEAEWEYACRAGDKTPRYGKIEDIAWVFANTEEHTNGSTGHRQVGKKKPNAWGLHDMLGNVSEWCSDWAGPVAVGFSKDPTGPKDGVNRIIRGDDCLADYTFMRDDGQLMAGSRQLGRAEHVAFES